MRLIDLSQPIYEGIPVYPGDPLFESRPFAEHESDGFHGARYTICSHLGTHLDAPFHFFVDGETLDSFHVDFFCGPAACLNLAPLIGPDSSRYRERVDLTRPVTATVDDLAPFEPIFDTTPIVLLRSGWSAHVGKADYFNDFPSLSPDVCEWLADYPKLRILGLETPSLAALPPGPATTSQTANQNDSKFDPELGEFLPDLAADGREPPFAPTNEAGAPARPLDEIELLADPECHRILLGRRPPILILEGLVRLAEPPSYDRPDDGSRVVPETSRNFELSCYPLAIRGADGSPTRAVARLD